MRAARTRGDRAATLADGCADLLGHLRGMEIPMAILTRNVREVVDTFARMFAFQFHAVYTREDGPPKPSPARRAVAVPGDGRRARGHARRRRLQVRRDRRAATPAAGRCWSAASHSPTHELADWGSPDMVVQSLRELLPLFRR